MIGELTLDGRIRCVPGVLPMTMAAAARAIHTVYVPEPQVGEAHDGARHACLRDPVAGPGRRPAPGPGGAGGPSGGATVGFAPAELARRGAARRPRHGGRDRDDRHPLRRRGGGGGRPPPDAHRAQGLGEDDAGRAPPGPAPRPQRGRVARAHRGALAVRDAPQRRVQDHQATLPGAPPLGVAHRHPRWRQRPGATGRGEQGSPRCAVPRRVPTVSQRRGRSAARTAGGRGDLDLPGRGGRRLPGPDDVRLRLQPVSVRGVQPAVPRPPVQLPRAQAPRVPPQDLGTDRGPDRHHPLRRAGHPPRLRRAAAVRAARAERGDPTPSRGRARAPATALCRTRLAAQRAGARTAPARGVGR